jgi:DNA-binding transcriptional LysR family regulator
VYRGLGVAWLPEHRIQGLLEQGVLARLPLLEGGSYRTPLYLMFGRAESPGPATRCLADLLKQAVVS